MTNFRIISTPQLIPSRVELARKNKGLSQAQLADILRVRQTTVHKIESGKTKNTRFLLDLSNALDVSADWLTGKIGEDNIIPDSSTKDSIFSRQFSDTVSLYDPTNLNQEIGMVEKHPQQENFKDAFAISLKDNSMEPRYRLGQIIYLISGKSPIPESDDILIRLKNENTVLGTFLHQNDYEVIVRKYNPSSETTIKTSEIKAIYLVTGTGRG